MKLAEFNAFCWRQWEDGGTVESVRLCAADLREMAMDVFEAPEAVPAHLSDAPTGPVGVRIDSIYIQPSRTVAQIDLAPDGEAATAVVKYGPTATTRTVAVGF